jgi:hypothetical protein
MRETQHEPPPLPLAFLREAWRSAPGLGANVTASAEASCRGKLEMSDRNTATGSPTWQPTIPVQPRPAGNRTGGHRPGGYHGHAEPQPFQLTSPIQPEADLHEAVARALDILLLPPAVWAGYPAGQHGELTAGTAEKLQRVGLKPNWPDILVIHGARIFGVELKTIDGELSTTREVRTRRGALRVVEGQADVFPRLERAGMRIAVCRTVDEVLAQLAAWGVPLRGWR